jgi:hypothetical protein
MSQDDRGTATEPDADAVSAENDEAPASESPVTAPNSAPDDEAPAGESPVTASSHRTNGEAQPAVPWGALPESARTAAIAMAARALGAVPADQVPTALAAVARFTPAKRARRGAVPLSRALERDASFRALVAQGLADTSPDALDPATAAARAFLMQLPGSDEAIAAAARADEVAILRAQVTQLTAAVEKLTARLAEGSPTPALDQHRKGAAASDAEASQEADRLRRRLREQGTKLKLAQQDAQRAVTEAERERDRAMTQAEQDRASAERWRTRADQEAHRAAVAQQVVDRFRDEAGRARADADRRIDLLLQTISQAANGLRREWQLTTGGTDPADLVAQELPDVTGTSRSVDASLLLDWFSLPGAHLIVDGYNVTKTGYPELTLADQRDRLTRALAALVARTGVEVTLVFDGAAVVAPATRVRGVRVMFSPPGVIADDVIRTLAAAEPAGRVLIVVSSDREVVDGVRRSGARTAPSSVLLAVLG